MTGPDNTTKQVIDSVDDVKEKLVTATQVAKGQLSTAEAKRMAAEVAAVSVASPANKRSSG